MNVEKVISCIAPEIIDWLEQFPRYSIYDNWIQGKDSHCTIEVGGQEFHWDYKQVLEMPNSTILFMEQKLKNPGPELKM